MAYFFYRTLAKFRLLRSLFIRFWKEAFRPIRACGLKPGPYPAREKAICPSGPYGPVDWNWVPTPTPPRVIPFRPIRACGLKQHGRFAALGNKFLQAHTGLWIETILTAITILLVSYFRPIRACVLIPPSCSYQLIDVKFKTSYLETLIHHAPH